MELTETQIKLWGHYVKGYPRPIDATGDDEHQLLMYGLIEPDNPTSNKEDYSGQRSKEPIPVRYHTTDKGIEWFQERIHDKDLKNTH